jgi:hypothetical protein
MSPPPWLLQLSGGKRYVRIPHTLEYTLKNEGAHAGDQRYGRFTPEDLRKIARQAKDLVHQIQRLKRTPLVRDFVTQGLIATDDLLAGSAADSACFDGLMRLPDLAKNYRSPQEAANDRLLSEVCRHVFEHTSAWNDRLICCLLQDADVVAASDENALRHWRNRKGLRYPRKAFKTQAPTL